MKEQGTPQRIAKPELSLPQPQASVWWNLQ